MCVDLLNRPKYDDIIGWHFVAMAAGPHATHWATVQNSHNGPLFSRSSKQRCFVTSGFWHVLFASMNCPIVSGDSIVSYVHRTWIYGYVVTDSSSAYWILFECTFRGIFLWERYNYKQLLITFIVLWKWIWESNIYVIIWPRNGFSSVSST